MTPFFSQCDCGILLEARVCLRVNGLGVFDRDAGVDLGRIELHVAEHLLHKADIGVCIVHGGGPSTPEQMATAFCRHARIADHFRYECGE